MHNLKVMKKLAFFLLIPAVVIATPKKLQNSDNPLMYPIIINDPAFEIILGKNPKLTQLAQGFGFAEGPVYFSSSNNNNDGYLLLSDLLDDKIYVIHWLGLQPFNQISHLSWQKPEIFRSTPAEAVGQTADLNGNLLTAEMTHRRISITNAQGIVQTLIGSYHDKPLNSPNDLVVKSDGSVWFTDPTYGCLMFGNQCYLPNNVYRFDPKNNKITLVIKGLIMPNGIAFSPDEKKLYVIDSGAGSISGQYLPEYPHVINVYDINADGKSVSHPRIFAQVSPGFPDGMRLDNQGNIYVGVLDGVHVINAQGELIGKILLPKQTANLTFGGKDNNILFIGSSSDVWAIKLNTHGVAPIHTLPMQD